MDQSLSSVYFDELTSVDLFRSSTISNSSTGAGEKRNTDGFEAAENDFVYETSCSLETKKYEMGKIVDRQEVPTTVQELSSNSNVTSHVDSEFSTTCKSTSSECKQVFEEQKSCSFSSTLEKQKKSFQVVTSLPPLPRSHSAGRFDFRKDSRSNSFSKSTDTSKESKNETNTVLKSAANTSFTRSELGEVSVMEPVEVKIKTLPRRNPNFVNFNKTEENLTEKRGEEEKVITNDEKGPEVVFKAEPAVIIDADNSRDNKGKSRSGLKNTSLFRKSFFLQNRKTEKNFFLLLREGFNFNIKRSLHFWTTFPIVDVSCHIISKPVSSEYSLDFNITF